MQGLTDRVQKIKVYSGDRKKHEVLKILVLSQLTLYNYTGMEYTMLYVFIMY
jgi:hypothetical protein